MLSFVSSVISNFLIISHFILGFIFTNFFMSQLWLSLTVSYSNGKTELNTQKICAAVVVIL